MRKRLKKSNHLYTAFRKATAMVLTGGLVSSIVLGMFSNPVHAETTKKMMNLVSAQNSSGNIQGRGTNYIFFGKNTSEANYFDACFRVLDNAKTNTGEPGMFLVSQRLVGDPASDYGGTMFNPYEKYNNVYQGSNAQSWCEAFLESNFSESEQSAMIATTKSDGAYTAHVVFWSNGEEKFYDQGYDAVENILNGDKLFPMSAEEADNVDYGFTTLGSKAALFGSGTGFYWLRSPVSGGVIYGGDVCQQGRIGWLDVRGDICMRPAFNLDTSKLVFTSAALNGKVSGAVGADCLQAVNAYTSREWKLTLKEDSRNDFGASFVSGNKDAVTISYTNAKTAAETDGNEYLSAIIVNGNGEINYYGNIKSLVNSADANGTVTLNLAGKYSDGDMLYVFNEQCNGDMKTDYTSSTIEITITETPEYPVVTLSSNSDGVKLSWDGIPSAAKYRVMRKEGSGKFTALAKVSGTTYTDSSVEAGKTYTYTVRCMDTAGAYFGDYDTVGKSITVTSSGSSPVVTLSNAENGVVVSWNAIEGAAKYRVMKKDESGTFVALAKVGATTYVDKTATEEGKTYTYTVRTMNDAGKYFGTYDKTGKSITYTKPVTELMVSDLKLKKKDTGIQLSWTAVEGAAQYRVMKKDESGKFVSISKRSKTYYTDTDVEEGKTYTYTVKCLDAEGKTIGTYDTKGKSLTY